MINIFVKFEESINNCLLSRLAKPYLENGNDEHFEYQMRKNKLYQYFPQLLLLLEDVNFRQELEIASSTLYSLLILYLELKTDGPWNMDVIKAEDYPAKLNKIFQIKYGIELEDMLLKNNDFYNAQEVFDKCIKELHQKMTIDDFRKYPALIEVYCMLVKCVKKYDITINPVTVLPVALLLVDDFTVSNKMKGLQCCALIFQCLHSNDFATGNFYEVVYRSIKNNIVEKDIEVTQGLFKCLPDFLKLLHSDVQKNKLDDVYSSILDQLYTESNLYRKAECLNFTTQIIDMHGIHCVKKRVFIDIICDNLDICSNEGVYEILIQHVLKCLLTWIRHCWCIWKLHNDHKILSSLLKILYVANDEETISQIQNLIITLIHLCTKEEQKQIFSSLEVNTVNTNAVLSTKIDKIKQHIIT